MVSVSGPFYSQNPHNFSGGNYYSEQERLEEVARDEARAYFDAATIPARTAYRERMADLAPYKNSPRWERERAAAKFRYSRDTAVAEALYEKTLAELTGTGEISEATSYAWDELIAESAMERAA